MLDARAKFPDSTLADLYDPLTMPPPLQKAHQSLDKAVDRAYRKTAFNNEAARVSFLFDLYQQYTTPLAAEKCAEEKTRTGEKSVTISYSLSFFLPVIKIYARPINVPPPRMRHILLFQYQSKTPR